MAIYLSLLKRIGLVWLGLLLLGSILCLILRPDLLSGWLWGMGIMAIYLAMLSVHSYTIRGVDTKDVMGKVRWQMVQRLLVVIVAVALGLAYVQVSYISLLIALALMHPILYVLQWQYPMDEQELKNENIDE